MTFDITGDEDWLLTVLALGIPAVGLAMMLIVGLGAAALRSKRRIDRRARERERKRAGKTPWSD